MKKLLKQIITMLIITCIMITGISFGGTDTANAAANVIEFIPGGAITMKLGETKNMRLTMHDSSGRESNYTDYFNWSTSDESVISLKVVDLFSTESDYVKIIVNGTGTAAVTCVSKNNPESTAKMTITVKAAKQTSKQRKCRHSWRTEKTATCERPGLKVCKKCQWKKVTSKSGHKWVDKTIVDEENSSVCLLLECYGCYCDDIPDEYREEGSLWHYDTGTKCKHPCGAKFTSEEYGSADAAWEAVRRHLSDPEHNGCIARVGTGLYYKDPCTKTVKACKWCGIEKQ